MNNSETNMKTMGSAVKRVVKTERLLNSIINLMDSIARESTMKLKLYTVQRSIFRFQQNFDLDRIKSVDSTFLIYMSEVIIRFFAGFITEFSSTFEI